MARQHFITGRRLGHDLEPTMPALDSSFAPTGYTKDGLFLRANNGISIAQHVFNRASQHSRWSAGLITCPSIQPTNKLDAGGRPRASCFHGAFAHTVITISVILKCFQRPRSAGIAFDKVISQCQTREKAMGPVDICSRLRLSMAALACPCEVRCQVVTLRTFKICRPAAAQFVRMSPSSLRSLHDQCADRRSAICH